MPDTRSRVDKLLAMAQQDSSPHERDRAREILRKRGLWPVRKFTADGGPFEVRMTGVFVVDGPFD